jgi:hypothetical protein
MNVIDANGLVHDTCASRVLDLQSAWFFGIPVVSFEDIEGFAEG